MSLIPGSLPSRLPGLASKDVDCHVGVPGFVLVAAVEVPAEMFRWLRGILGASLECISPDEVGVKNMSRRRASREARRLVSNVLPVNLHFPSLRNMQVLPRGQKCPCIQSSPPGHDLSEKMLRSGRERNHKL